MYANGKQIGISLSDQTTGQTGRIVDRVVQNARPSNSLQSPHQVQMQPPVSSEMLSQSFSISNSESPSLLPLEVRLMVGKAEKVISCF